MNVAICDDEENARRYLKLMIEKLDEDCRIIDFSSGGELLKFWEREGREQIDILFLDISMNISDTVFLSVLNIVGIMLARMVIDISTVQIDKEVFYLFSQKKEMVWKVPMIAVFICIGEISAIYIYVKYKELQKEREKHFVEEQQIETIKKSLEEAEKSEIFFQVKFAFRERDTISAFDMGIIEI